MNEAVINDGAFPSIAGCTEVNELEWNVVWVEANIDSSSLPRGALKFSISNELETPCRAIPSIDSGSIT